ncbi:MAG: 5-(carboxyamino)imidazole ribonucleotide mutase [Candidatus Methanoplasma sp.]|nr:5-(carboxyamino)imidazole ribonucleotide mutase [Candidatus Methanoplasma sp.]
MMQKVLILMGSKSDLPVAEKAITMLKKFNVDYEIAVASAHRTPERVKDFVTSSDAEVFIAIAGLSAALPGVVAAHTCKPVIGVPVSGGVNLDALLSVVQMPPGIPVAAVGLDRGDNAAILAIEIMGVKDPKLSDKMKDYRKEQAEKIEADSKQVVADVGRK